MPLGLDEDEQETGPYPEPPLARISFSPSVEQCYRAIYPNISHYFTQANYPSIDMSVYRAVFTGREDVILPEVLTQNRWVWDAHVTEEHWVMSPVKVERVARVRFKNQKNVPELTTPPFDDPAEPRRKHVGPTTIDFSYLSRGSSRTSRVGSESISVALPASAHW